MADDDDESDIRSIDEDEAEDDRNKKTNKIQTTRDPQVLYISWQRVLTEFELRFDGVFEESTVSVKAHLDLTEILVDGAKGRWRHVLLLDCLAAFWLQKDKSRAECEGRRRFDQYAALREAVTTAAAESFIARCFRGQSDVPSRMMLVNVPQPWCDSALLEKHFLDDTTLRRQAAEQLFSLPLVKERGFVACVSEVVGQLYAQHFGGDRQRDPRFGVDRFAQQESSVHARCSELAAFSAANITNHGNQAWKRPRGKTNLSRVLEIDPANIGVAVAQHHEVGSELDEAH